MGYFYDSRDTSAIFRQAFETRDLAEFMSLIFPPEWAPIGARILESGATMSTEMCDWAPRWSKISPTWRGEDDPTSTETHVRSCLYRAHDCLHQLWGLPTPRKNFPHEDFRLFKRAAMCGEVVVLTLTEFVLAKRLAEMHPYIESLLETRDALLMVDGPLRGRTIAETATRLDGLLHKKLRPNWVVQHGPSTRFCDYYIPMLQYDRDCIDSNWELMVKNSWLPDGIPNARYSRTTDGLELTLWMIADFIHQLDTDDAFDVGLAAFNRSRREGIVLPKGWNLS